MISSSNLMKSGDFGTAYFSRNVTLNVIKHATSTLSSGGRVGFLVVGGRVGSLVVGGTIDDAM